METVQLNTTTPVTEAVGTEIYVDYEHGSGTPLMVTSCTVLARIGQNPMYSMSLRGFGTR